MEFQFIEFALLLFIAAIALVAYDLPGTLKAPVCPECAHCRGEQEAARRLRADARCRNNRPLAVR